jgi:hypothetical protein
MQMGQVPGRHESLRRKEGTVSRRRASSVSIKERAVTVASLEEVNPAAPTRPGGAYI